MAYRLVFRQDKARAATESRYASMDDALDALQVLEDFDRAEGFYTENVYAVIKEEEYHGKGN